MMTETQHPTDTQKKTGYLDCFSGISGDMLLGSFIHLGLDENSLLAEIAKLKLDGLRLEIESRLVQGISCINLSVHCADNQQFRTLPVIEKLLRSSDLAPDVTSQSLAIFKKLAQAEATVHQMPIDQVHFHEVGAVDTIVDIVGSVFALKTLGIHRLICSPLPMGRGFVECAHGRLPLPAPAVCELLAGVPTYGVELEQELVTPTGAALAVCLADQFGSMPPMTIDQCGYGAGDRTFTNGQPNLLRIICGIEETVQESQTVEVIETNLDDWNPEGFPYLTERLFEAGALDVSLCPLHMKKGRPGFRLQVISSREKALLLRELILSESSAIGLRYRLEQRRTLVRRKVLVDTRWGAIAAKEIEAPNRTIIRPEYEECRKIAVTHGIPLEEVYLEIQREGGQKCTD